MASDPTISVSHCSLWIISVPDKQVAVESIDGKRLSFEVLGDRLQLPVEERLLILIAAVVAPAVKATGDTEAEGEHRVRAGDRTVRLDIGRDEEVRSGIVHQAILVSPPASRLSGYGRARMNRAEYSQARIEELGDRLAPVEELLRDEPLCIYATGSYARLEAGEESDIDIFFLYEGHPLVQRLPNLTLIQLSACLIDATREMGFPPFSEDGRYLDVHYLDHMEEVLGSPDDDSLNAFTARMLLLLESRPVCL